MKIQINGEKLNINNKNLAKLIIELNYDYEAVATALNGYFVTISQRDTIILNENDQLEILAPMQGG